MADLPNKGKEKDFQVIRSAPVEESPPIVPILILVVLGVVVLGGYFLFSGETKVENGNGAGGGQPTATVSVPDEVVPDWEVEAIEFSLDQYNFQIALQKVEAALEKYPGSRYLAEKRRFLHKELGMGSEDAATAPKALLEEGRRLMSAGSHSEALDQLDELVEQEPGGEVEAEAWFLRGRCLISLGQKLEARNSLNDALALGYDEAEVERWLDSLE